MIFLQKYTKSGHLGWDDFHDYFSKILENFTFIQNPQCIQQHMFFTRFVLYMVILEANKKLFYKGIYNAVLVNHMRLTYGDFEKVSKKHENAMKNGKFINFFLMKNGKNVFYYGE